ncbi:hypothetical protein, partial [Protofrankia coriariae]|uniref:hypothetical protein n=1 Tax=Protofrankia coriariae TaxID=1562887 RepID=UPI001F3DA578
LILAALVLATPVEVTQVARERLDTGGRVILPNLPGVPATPNTETHSDRFQPSSRSVLSD